MPNMLAVKVWTDIVHCSASSSKYKNMSIQKLPVKSLDTAHANYLEIVHLVQSLLFYTERLSQIAVESLHQGPLC